MWSIKNNVLAHINEVPGRLYSRGGQFQGREMELTGPLVGEGAPMAAGYLGAQTNWSISIKWGGFADEY